eukprot:Sdes_comp20477_c0_seq1m14778
MVGQLIGLLRKIRIVISHLEKKDLGEELFILSKCLYKNHYQHRRGVYFKKTSHVYRLSKRLAKLNPSQILQNVLLCFPFSSKYLSGLTSLEQIQSHLLPSPSKLITPLAQLEICKQLTEYISSACREACFHLQHMLSRAEFIPLCSLLYSSLSRIDILLQYTIQDISQALDALQPWKDILETLKNPPPTRNVASCLDKKMVSSWTFVPAQHLEEDLGEPI